eukprot:29340-Chlamydomonas_euryale.AAC.1
MQKDPSNSHTHKRPDTKNSKHAHAHAHKHPRTHVHTHTKKATIDTLNPKPAKTNLPTPPQPPATAPHRRSSRGARRMTAPPPKQRTAWSSFRWTRTGTPPQELKAHAHSADAPRSWARQHRTAA